MRLLRTALRPLRVLVVDTDSLINTFVGSGQPGYPGDGGPATEAIMNGVKALAISDAGTVFIGEDRNYLMPGVQEGTIVTAAGGLLDDGSSIEALFHEIYGLALEASGNLYISSRNHCIRMIDLPQALPSGKIGPIGLDLDTTFEDQGLCQTPENPVAGDNIEVEVFITEGANGEGGFEIEFA
jgi:hypothetical protein